MLILHQPMGCQWAPEAARAGALIYIEMSPISRLQPGVAWLSWVLATARSLVMRFKEPLGVTNCGFQARQWRIRNSFIWPAVNGVKRYPPVPILNTTPWDDFIIAHC